MLTSVLLLFDCGGLLLIFSYSPFFGVFGVLLHSIAHACLLCLLGVPFFALLMVVVYVGGMLIVFLFSTVLSAERYPEFDYVLFLVFLRGRFVLTLPFLSETSGVRKRERLRSLVLTEGFTSQYSSFALLTCLVGLILLVALVVVLEFGFEHSRGCLRKL